MSHLVRRIGGALPPEVATATRRVVRGAGRATAELRFLPSFLVVGAQRCGTTTLFRVLSSHPQVVRPVLAKGIGYFDVNHQFGLRWYRGHFPVRALAGLRRRDAGPLVAFESSGYSCYHPLAADRIAAELPGVRLVMLVRDPVDRAFSAWKHERARGFETCSFAEALSREPERLRGEADRIRTEPGYRSFRHRHHSYLGRGRYAPQVRRLQAAVGADRVHVVDAHDFFTDPAGELAVLLDWLGLAPFDPGPVAAWNARPGGSVPAALRAALLDELAGDDDDLAELLGRTPSWRR